MLLKHFVLLAALLYSSQAFANQNIPKLIPDAEKVGQGTLSFAFWDIYDAALYAPDGKLDESTPFVLSLRYMREISAKDIVSHSVKEIRRQGFADEERLAKWEKEMSNIFPDVQDGLVLSAVFIPGKETIFYQDDKAIGRVKDPEFTRFFANIWLGDNTLEPALRNKLLGLS
jgi:hypothetical protein